MSINNDQKVDYLWKKIGYGKSKTDTNSQKKAVNESISSPLLIRGDVIWVDPGQIPSTIPSSSSSIVTVYGNSLPVECSVDQNASTNRTWLSNVTDWIGTEFGATYIVNVYVHDSNDASSAVSNGTKLTATGSGNDDEWFFDYQSGVLNFIGDNLPNNINFSGSYFRTDIGVV